MCRVLWLVLALGLASFTQAAQFSLASGKAVDVQTGIQLDLRTPLPPITQSSDTSTITVPNSVACGAGSSTTQNFYARRFDLDTDHGINGFISVSSVQFGVEQLALGSASNLPIEVRLYSIPNGSALLWANMSLIGSSPLALTNTSAPYMLNTPVVGSVNGSTQDLVVVIDVSSGESTGSIFFIGSNTAAESRPSYIGAPACGFTELVALDDLSYPTMNIVMVVYADLAQPADLSIVKTDGYSALQPGSLVSYSIQVTNNGPLDASSVVVTDPRPLGLSFVSAVGVNWTCGYASGVVTCTRPSLTVGAAEPITVNFYSSVLLEQEVSNTATVAFDSFDPNLANNNSTDVTYIGWGDPLCSGVAPILSMDFATGEITCAGAWSLETDGEVNVLPGAAVHFLSPLTRLRSGFKVQVGGAFDANPR